VCKAATDALSSDTDQHIKIFLTYFKDFEKANRKSSDVPGWITSYNFCSLLNLPSIIREFGYFVTYGKVAGWGGEIL
jgi:hypothetical protein